MKERKNQLVEALTAHILERLEKGNLEEVSFLRRTKANITSRSNYLQTGAISGQHFRSWWLENMRNEKYPAELSALDLGIETTYSILSGVIFPKNTIFTSDWSDSDFSDADLSGAKFIESVCQNVDFSGADLSKADMTSSDFTSANFSKAILWKADLRPASEYFTRAFHKADFTGANLSDSFLQGVDLRDTINLHTANLDLALYDENTKFPVNFKEQRYMRYVGSDIDLSAAQKAKDEFWLKAAKGMIGM